MSQPQQAAIVKPPGVGRTIGVVGDVYRFLATGDDTDGKYALMEAIVLPGGGPPPHIHRREQESFYVLEGEVSFWAGTERIVLGAGNYLSIPIGLVHAFKNEGDQAARMLISMAPAGLEKMFLEVGRPLAEGATMTEPPSPAEIELLLAAASRYGVEILPPS